jgi:hypothetical protein
MSSLRISATAKGRTPTESQEIRMEIYWEDKNERRYSDEHATVSINGKVYRLLNINDQGAGFLFDSMEDIIINGAVEPRFVGNLSAGGATAVPRFILLYNFANRRLRFKSGWIHGPVFTTRHDLNARKLLQEFIAENINRDEEMN